MSSSVQAAIDAGSSPLARGLLGLVGLEALEDRIIPARAGFTAIGTPYVWGGSDHPRSRGVYGTAGGVQSGWDGSSPLARGLPPLPHLAVLAIRIIPARAGFTACPRRGSPWRTDHPRSRGVYDGRGDLHPRNRGSSPLARGLREPARRGRPARLDHPRSRGVYATSPMTRTRARGSSPLARGLHTRGAVHMDPDGIIPARAGFTLLK